MNAQMNRARGVYSRHRILRWALLVWVAGASSASNAQSSVTLYGIIDTGFEYVTNIGPKKSSGVHVPTLTASLPSLWGLRGKEDLGGGLSAVFVLESGFAPSQGTLNQGGRLFGRQAYVGLSGSWGTVTLGRQYSQIFWALLPEDTLAPNIYAAADLDPYLTQPRVDNAITYTFKSSGLTVGVTYSLGRDAVDSAAAGGCAGQSPGNWRACKAISAMVKYDAAQWGVGAAFDRNYGGDGTGSPLPLGSQTDTRAVIDGYVKFSSATIGAGLVHRIDHGAQTPNLFDVVSNYWWIGGSWFPVPEVALDAQFGHISVDSNASGGSVIAARAMYFLSKRTAVYVTAGHVFNERNAAFSIDGGVVPPASTPLPGVDQTGVMVDMRHQF
ncbi:MULTISPECIES: porin [Paraburkholderia]|uniref:porin n=1 Tax=Paraburkholderia TaxID=1822464 RepID=UPI00225B2847|nr:MULTISPECIES: porin [Paraburkholderia]MCX4163164.1 porin [Paraburkholderia megapolitana]MDN7158660.1 porin [Paraburkholderia sp. CHISQ3]MDQ6495707.1 porin [Paraburkholderia megapolitana]